MNPPIEVNGVHFGIDEAILAVSSYFCHTHMDLLHREFFSVMMQVVSSISAEDQESSFRRHRSSVS